MSLYGDVRSALRAKLATVVTLPPSRAFEARVYEPELGTAWVRDTLLPGPAARLALGPLARVRHFALYQIDVFVPARQGTAADSAADDIVAAFWPGLILTTGTQVLTVQTASRAAARTSEDGAWRQLPVTIDLMTHTTNPA